jgi:hypothetical protein
MELPKLHVRDLFWLVLVCAICLPGPVTGEEWEVEKSLLAGRNAEDSASFADAALAAQKYVEGLSDAELIEQCKADSTTLALLSAWRRVKLARDTSPHNTEWFCGFVEGRLGVSVPQSWAARHRADAFWFRDQDSTRPQKTTIHKCNTYLIRGNEPTCEVPYRSAAGDRKMAIFLCTKGTLTRSEHELSFADGDQRCTIPLDDFPTMPVREADLHFSLDSGQLVFAINPHNRGAVIVQCHEAKTGKKQWRSTSWESGSTIWPGGKTGAGHHCMELRRTKDAVILFGEIEGSYIDAFRLADGKPLYRYSSNMWGAHEKP